MTIFLNMKPILPFIILALCAGSSLGQLNVWRWQNPLPEGDLLHAVQMISLQVTYACGDNGTFLQTSDGGATWNSHSNLLTIKAPFNSLSFIDRQYGMVCGDSGYVLKTTDGGSSWKKLNTASQNKFNSIVLIDTNIALMVTMGGGILKTTNGGTSWFSIAIEGNYALYSINKLRPDFLTISGYGGTLLKSVDSGKSWHRIQLPYGNTFFSSHFFNDSTGTIIGDFGLILHTTDGGSTWIKQFLVDSALTTAALNVVDGKDPNVFAIAGDHGTLLYTSGGGRTWLQSDIGTADDVKGLSFFDKLTATAVGRNGIIVHTTDGGVTWTYQPSKRITDISHSIAFPKGDTSLGIAVGDNGTILRTNNGGKEWAIIESGVTYRLNGVCFMGPESVIAVGDYGMILKSTDAGLTWNPQLSSTTQHLYSVSFATRNDGLVVGDSNTVLKTYSAGEFWTREFVSPPSRPPWLLPVDFFKSVSYPDKSHAFMTGFHVYYFSVDGGVNWKFKCIDPLDTEVQVTIGGTGVFPISTLYSISFADSLHGGLTLVEIDTRTDQPIDSDKFIYTTDGFDTWHWQRNSNLTGVFINIHYVDLLHATAVGTGGCIANTTNGGVIWLNQQSNTLNNLYGVCFGTLQAGTAVGNHGNILRITTDEIPSSSVAERGASGEPKIIFDGNCPNPFSSHTTISYHLPASGFTTVEIFSVIGERIALLANEYELSGDHNILFDASGIASGAYLCRISSGGMSAVGKLKIEN